MRLHQRASITCCAFALIALGWLLTTQEAAAITPGRAWAPTDTLKIAGRTFLAPQYFEPDPDGAPFLVAEAVGGLGQDAFGFKWVGSTWVATWQLGYPTAYIKPADSGSGWSAVWQTVQPMGPNGNMVALVFADVFEDHVGIQDTIAVVAGSNFAYAGAVRGNRRWVAKHDFYYELRLWTSEIPGSWTELEMPGVGAHGLAMGAVDDTTVLIVFQWSAEGTRWGYMRGSTWEEGKPLITSDGLGGGVIMRRNQGGGFWAGWSNKTSDLAIARYQNGEWGPVTSIGCGYRVSDQYFSSSSSLSRDPFFEYPSAAWSSFGSHTGDWTICACIPTDNGFTLADNLENSAGGILPMTVRDKNGDAWVGWATLEDGMFYTHTYTIATSSAPGVLGAGSNRTIHWTLSELAPETWWAVLAARNDGPFEEVARVRAADALDLEWTDTSEPADSIRYRIRRECVDTRYQWLSDETVWHDEPVAVDLALVSAEVKSDHVRLEWYGAGASGLNAMVERRRENAEWESLGAATVEGADQLSYDDRSIVPGTRYGYRLAYTEDGVERHTAESWVDVSAALALALEGFVPNPSIRTASVAFTLPESGRAVLEVVDIAGRRVFRRDVGSLGAGRHVVRLETGAMLRPGVYMIRLTRGGATVHSRGVITR